MKILDMNLLKIKPFSPNCLLGSVEAAAKVQFCTPNFDRLYFRHSFEYKKRDECFINSNGVLNFRINRELPISKEMFMHRILYYYGISVLYKEYKDFKVLLQDLQWLSKGKSVLITEIDFYYVNKHRFYQKANAQHTMIIHSVNNDTLGVCEAIFGNYWFPMSDYEAFFYEVTQQKMRPFYLMAVRQSEPIEYPLTNFSFLREDLVRTLRNLNHRDDMGVAGLRQFIEQFKKFQEINLNGKREIFYMPGMWTFACDAMANMAFISQLIKDYPEYATDTWQELRILLTKLNRLWFALTLSMESAIKHQEIMKTVDMAEQFMEVYTLETKLAMLISKFQTEIEKVFLEIDDRGQFSS